MARVQRYRWEYDRGRIPLERLREILGQFRFKDDYGRLWMPGVNSNSWYMWENGRWTLYAPPETLNLPSYEERIEAFKARSSENASFCISCGQRLRAGATFCQRCGQPVQL